MFITEVEVILAVAVEALVEVVAGPGAVADSPVVELLRIGKLKFKSLLG